MEIADFLKELESVDLPTIDVPEFRIPNWPGIRIDGSLGKAQCRIPEMIGSTGLLRWKTGWFRIYFDVSNSGVVQFQLRSCWFFPMVQANFFATHSSLKLDRVIALMLFDQFKTEMFAQILTKYHLYAPVNNQVARAIMRAFEPFMPFLVAEKLAK